MNFPRLTFCLYLCAMYVIHDKISHTLFEFGGIWVERDLYKVPKLTFVTWTAVCQSWRVEQLWLGCSPLLARTSGAIRAGYPSPCSRHWVRREGKHLGSEPQKALAVLKKTNWTSSLCTATQRILIQINRGAEVEVWFVLPHSFKRIIQWSMTDIPWQQ